MRLPSSWLAVAVVPFALAPPGWPVQTPDQPVRFAAASVRANTDGATGQSMRRLPGGRFTAVNVSAHSLLLMAFNGFQAFQIAGGPSWIRTDRFDIVAKLEGESLIGPGVPDHFALAMRTLLAERFGLVVHRETRDHDVYALVTVKPGVPGAGLRRSPLDCSPQAIAARRGEPAPPPGSSPVCSSRQIAGGRESRGVTMANFVTGLGGYAGRMVIDRTGLSGAWDFDLVFSLDPADTTAPSVFTALQEQLGLRLQPATEKVEFVVVDRLERPSSD